MRKLPATGTDHDNHEDLGRDHHRRRPQRPGQRLLSAARGARRAGRREERLGRRRRRQPLADAGLPLFQLFLCLLAVPPEIMRDLELPRFGLQVIAYEGGAVFTRDGDYLANYRDHDAPSPRIRAASRKRDAEAYDRYARDVTRQCRFIQPLLMRTAPDPTSFRPRDISANCCIWRKKFGELGAARDGRDAALLDHVDLRLPRRIFRDRRHQGQFRDLRHHRHGARADVARHGLCAAASLHGRGRRLGRRLGLCARRHGRDHQGAAPSLPRLGRHDPHRRRGRPGAGRRRQGDRRRARRRRGDRAASSSSPTPT